MGQAIMSLPSLLGAIVGDFTGKGSPSTPSGGLLSNTISAGIGNTGGVLGQLGIGSKSPATTNAPAPSPTKII